MIFVVAFLIYFVHLQLLLLGLDRFFVHSFDIRLDGKCIGGRLGCCCCCSAALLGYAASILLASG